MIRKGGKAIGEEEGRSLTCLGCMIMISYGVILYVSLFMNVVAMLNCCNVH